MSQTALERQIRSQPEELDRLATHPVRHDVVERLAQCRRIWLVGTGTSLHAAELGAAMLYEAGRGAQAIPSMHFVNWAPPVDPRDGMVLISHNAGEETVHKETSQTYTVSYTAVLLLLARIANALGAESLSPEAIGKVPGAVAEAIENPGLDRIVAPRRLLLLFGEGPASVTAREGALKLREASRFPAEGYDVEYLLHGSAVPLGDDDHLVALTPPDTDGLVRAVGDAAEHEGTRVTALSEPADLPPLLAQIPLTVRLQILTNRERYLGQERGQV